MRKLTKDESSNKTTTVDVAKKITTVTHTVKPDEKSPARYELIWIMDFSKCTEEQILGLASRSATILKQADWRRADDKDRMNANKWHNVTFDVAEEMSGRRKAADPVAKTATQAKKLNKDEREALIKQLQAMDN